MSYTAYIFLSLTGLPLLYVKYCDFIRQVNIAAGLSATHPLDFEVNVPSSCTHSVSSRNFCFIVCGEV
jgi:hypothetical protein